MKNYQNFDFKLGEILQSLSDLHGEFKDLMQKFSENDKKEYNYAIGNSICALSDMRQKIIWAKYPNLMLDYAKEDKENSRRIQSLDEICKEASDLLKNADYQKVKEKLQELLKKAEYGHYKKVAEIMLYECEHRIKKDLDEMKIKTYQTYEKLDKIYQKGLKFENEKEFTKAIEIYENLLKTSKFSEFENKAMAGLYRCEKALNLY